MSPTEDTPALHAPAAELFDPSHPPRWRGAPEFEGALRTHPEDFQVHEIPAFLPSGEGTHLFVQLRKRDLTTPEAVRRLCQAVGADPRSAGWAGMKDRRAVTTQWISLEGQSAESLRPEALAPGLEGIEVLQAIPHQRKLKTAQLRGNRFELRVRGLCDPDGLVQALSEVKLVPNYFGGQRFGRDNLQRAREWLIDGASRGPRSRVDRRFLVSTLQSAAFNEVVARRVLARSLDQVLDGDLLQTQRGGIFAMAEDPDPQARLDAGEICPTAPLPGSDVRWATGEALALEREVADRWHMTDATFRRMGKLGRGTRRAVFVRPGNLASERDGDDVCVRFELPPGSYATVVLGEVLMRKGTREGQLGRERAKGS